MCICLRRLTTSCSRACERVSETKYHDHVFAHPERFKQAGSAPGLTDCRLEKAPHSHSRSRSHSGQIGGPQFCARLHNDCNSAMGSWCAHRIVLICWPAGSRHMCPLSWSQANDGRRYRRGIHVVGQDGVQTVVHISLLPEQTILDRSELDCSIGDIANRCLRDRDAPQNNPSTDRDGEGKCRWPSPCFSHLISSTATAPTTFS